MEQVTIRIVKEQPCPTCGAIDGHKSELLDFPNRPKIAGENGQWWWRCYNPSYATTYYLPETGEVE